MREADSSERAAPRVADGSPVSEGFEPFYVANYHRVVALAVVLSGDRGEAEELAQEAFAAAHGRWVDLQHYDNAVSGHRRRLSETKGLRLLGARQSAGLPYGTEHRGELWAAVRDLPDRQAQAVALFYLGDRSVASVAELMDLSEGAVKSHLSRARKTLANRLGMEDEK
jgi:RNA polymerase sigma-70 factor (ECF subfamily)